MKLHEATPGNRKPGSPPPPSSSFATATHCLKGLLAICFLLGSAWLLQRPAQAAVATGQPLTLADALRIAVERNRDLRLADIAVRAAQAGAITAGAAPNPNLTRKSVV